jgi:hypothetical protein
MSRAKSLLSIAAIFSTLLFQQQSNAGDDSKAKINAGHDSSKPATVSAPVPNTNPTVPSSYSGVGDSGRRETGTTGVRPAK